MRSPAKKHQKKKETEKATEEVSRHVGALLKKKEKITSGRKEGIQGVHHRKVH